MATFKVMTWNLENLFLPGTQFGPETQADYTQKLNTLTEAISTLDPDVLAVQEVGSPETFSDLIDQLDGRYPHARLSNAPDSRGIRVGFLSKISIEDEEDIVTFPSEGLPSVPDFDSQGNPSNVNRLSRGALRVQIRPRSDFAVHLLGAHLKSKLLTFTDASGRSRFSPKDENERARVAGVALLKRTAEAVALRIKANELLADNERNGLILLGDFNDAVEAATTQLLQGPSGSEIGTVGFARPDEGDEARLFNLAPLIPEPRRFSRIYRGSKELIDHILVSQELLPGQPRRLPVVDSHVDLAATLPSVSDDPNLRRGKPGSDHAPVTAIFDL
ncbi:MAG: endonuclease/exonuclease/phosphatase family protein [Microcystaceae cyanobacterium]